MQPHFLRALHATTALQVAIYEMMEEPVLTKARDSLALVGVNKCLEELTSAVKAMKKSAY